MTATLSSTPPPQPPGEPWPQPKEPEPYPQKPHPDGGPGSLVPPGGVFCP